MSVVATEPIDVVVHSIEVETPGIRVFDLRSSSGDPLPGFTAGAHVDVHLPNGMMRSYSLVNPQGETDRYVIAVSRDAVGRGGSRFMHDAVVAGMTLRVGSPGNNFALDESAAHTVLIGGGIGITPLWCMAQRLTDLGRPWTLHYSNRTRTSGAFIDRIATLAARAGANLNLVFSREPDGGFLDIATAVADAQPASHFYCCGPQTMIAGFREATRELRREQVHVESFRTNTTPKAKGGFAIVLAQTGGEMFVPEDKTILDVLIAANVKGVRFSCMEGECGSCEVRVLAGRPDHRDEVLTSEEKASNRTMMVCCSGSVDGRLVLDI